MNERIKLLRQAARHFACATEIPGSDQWFEKCDTKFAELIIQECIELDDRIDYTLAPHETLTVGSRIAEHFGVK